GKRHRPGELVPETAEVAQDRGLALAVGRDLEQIDDDGVAGLGAVHANGPRDRGERMAVTRRRERRRHETDVSDVAKRAPDFEREFWARRYGQRGRRGRIDVEQIPGARRRHVVTLRTTSS